MIVYRIKRKTDGLFLYISLNMQCIEFNKHGSFYNTEQEAIDSLIVMTIAKCKEVDKRQSTFYKHCIEIYQTTIPCGEKELPADISFPRIVKIMRSYY